MRNGSYSSWYRRHISELKRYCVGSYCLLFWAQLLDFSVNQSLKHILEDVAVLGGVPNHPVVQEIFGIIHLADILWASGFRKLEFVALLE